MQKHSTTRFVILGLLTIKPMSGYDIKKMIDYSISHFWKESNGQLYPTLRTLLQEEKISIQKEEKRKKTRYVYSIQQDGIIELKNWMRQSVEKQVHRDELLLKLFFGANSSTEEMIQRVKERKEIYEQQLRVFTAIMDKLEETKDSPHHIFWVLSLKNGIISVRGEIEWCEEAIKALEKYKKPTSSIKQEK